jgi:hypothetical protein
MSTETTKKKDPYAAFIENSIFFTTSFRYGFQLVDLLFIEWQVYSITKDPH